MDIFITLRSLHFGGKTRFFALFRRGRPLSRLRNGLDKSIQARCERRGLRGSFGGIGEEMVDKASFYWQPEKMKMFELTSKRREALGNFFLNLAVACMAVAAFEGKWWGIIPAGGAVLTFFALSKEK